MAGLLACPQLLSDDFGAISATGDDTCARRLTCAGAGGAGVESGAAGRGGSASGSGGSGASAGGSSVGGAGSGEAGSGQGGSGDAGASWGEAGNAGGSDSADASVDPPDLDPDPDPACWLIGLEDSTHSASDNCLGINGWNAVETDPASNTTVSTTYDDGTVCFTGTIDNVGWGAVYNLTLNDPPNSWDALARGVGGFRFEASGAPLPPEIEVKYTDKSSGDYCRIITPGPAVEVPFASAHPGCSTTSSSVTDAVDLTFIRLVFPPEESDYAIDFCLGIRAMP